MNTLVQRRIFAIVLAALMAFLMVACGGGGGGSPSSPTNKSPAITISGVVASGAPVANGAGYALDAATGTTIPFTTDANGNYSMVLTGYSGPFLFHVIGINSTGTSVDMYSLGTLSNSGGTLNITPLTDVVLAYASGVNTQLLESYCIANLSACPGTLNAIYAKLTAANTAVVNAISSTLTSGLPGTFNVFTTVFTADNTGVDALLDKLLITKSQVTGPSSYTISLAAAASGTPVATVPTTGTVGTQSPIAPTSYPVSSIAASQAANLAAILLEIAKFAAARQAAQNSSSLAAAVTALTPLFDATYLGNGLNKATYLAHVGLGTAGFLLNEVLAQGGVAAYSGAPLAGSSPGPSVTYDANNCVTSIWVNFSLNGLSNGTRLMLDTGYNPTTCLGGTWTTAGNQRQFNFNLYAETISQPSNGLIRPGLSFNIPNAQNVTYTKVVVSGPGLVTSGAQTTLSPVTLSPTDPTLGPSGHINDPFYSATTANPYYVGDGYSGIEGGNTVVFCVWLTTSINSGWSLPSASTPCINGDAVAGADYTFQFYNGATLVETDMQRLTSTPSATIPAAWYPTISSVTPPGNSLSLTGGNVTVNWTLPTGAHSSGVFLNLNGPNNGNTVDNKWNTSLINNVTSTTIATGTIYATPIVNGNAAFVFTNNNNMSLVTLQFF